MAPERPGAVAEGFRACRRQPARPSPYTPHSMRRGRGTEPPPSSRFHSAYSPCTSLLIVNLTADRHRFVAACSWIEQVGDPEQATSCFDRFQDGDGRLSRTRTKFQRVIGVFEEVVLFVFPDIRPVEDGVVTVNPPSDLNGGKSFPHHVRAPSYQRCASSNMCSCGGRAVIIWTAGHPETKSVIFRLPSGID